MEATAKVRSFIAALKDVFAPTVDPLIRALTGGTVFGVGGAQKERLDHAVLDMVK